MEALLKQKNKPSDFKQDVFPDLKKNQEDTEEIIDKIDTKFDKEKDLLILPFIKNNLYHMDGDLQLKENLEKVDELLSIDTKFLKNEFSVILNSYIQFLANKILSILDNPIELNESTKFILKSFRDRVNDVLIESSENNSKIRLNTLGLPMNDLEIEVDDLIQGLTVFPNYNRKEYGDPLAYLKKHYGKYLKKFNGDTDYLYQDQLEIISPSFKETLRKHLLRDGKKLNDFVPKKSIRLDREADSIRSHNSYDDIVYRKISCLVSSGRF